MSTYPERASLEGLEFEIFKLVSKGATPQQWREWLRVPLEHAAAQGNHGLVDKLLGAGANGGAGWKGCGGRSLLYAAAAGGSEGVVSCLLRAGAKPDVNMLVPAPSGRSPLYQAVRSGHDAVARLLIHAGADVNFQDPVNKFTVLHAAIFGGHKQLAKELMIGGADISACDAGECTPLHLAAGEGLNGIVSILLLKEVEKNAVDVDGSSALMYASGAYSSEAHLAVVEALLAAGADVNVRHRRGMSALDWASRSGHVPVIQALARHGVDVNSRDEIEGYSALHKAAGFDQADSVDALMKAGADMEMKTNGKTPLCVAAEGGNPKALLALLQNGADIRVQDNDGDTPLHAACIFQQEGIEAIVDFLLRWGADETALNDDGRSPNKLLDEVHVDRTCSQSDIERVRLLLSRAPADRAWRRRGWLAMLRSRASRVPDNASGAGAESFDDACGGVGDSSRRQVARSGEAVDVSGGGEGAQAASGEGDVGHEMMGGIGHGVFSDAVVRLVGLELEGVFRTVVGFL